MTIIADEYETFFSDAGHLEVSSTVMLDVVANTIPGEVDVGTVW